MPQEATDLGTVVVTGRRVSFPFGASPGGGGGSGPPPGDADTIDPIENPVEELCTDISFLADGDKEKYIVNYLGQKIAEQIKNNPVQDREWGSAIYQDSTGNYNFTSFLATTTHQARINWAGLPQVNGNPDWGTVRGFIHSHPRDNLPINPTTGVETVYYNGLDPSYLLRPWDGDWDVFTHIQNNMGSSPGAADLTMFILGYTEDASGAGRLSLHGYNASHNPGSGSTPTATPEITGLQPPCN